jgi:hypothetical protein
MPETMKCRSCGAPIKWVTMANSKRKNPLDAEPVINGNISVHPDGTARVLGAVERLEFEGPLYVSHFATCIHAKQHRKAK